VGHVLATASNDHRVKFWCRARPGDDLEQDLDPTQLQLIEARAAAIGYERPEVIEPDPYENQGFTNYNDRPQQTRYGPTGGGRY